MLQLAAHELGIPLDAVFIAETATDKVPNASPTAASASSDMYGGAVTDACRQINERLEPYRKDKAAFTVRPLLATLNLFSCICVLILTAKHAAESINKAITSKAIHPRPVTASHDRQASRYAS